MKIIFTGDSHVFYGQQQKAVIDMMDCVRREHPDIVVNCGDIGEILTFNDGATNNHILLQELFSIQPTLFVMGNHDMYTKDARYNPPQALGEFLKVMKYGIPLQTSWTDTKTAYEKDGCLFLGTIGFPCFSEPRTMMPPKYLDDGCPTIDGSFINLRGGWLQYTRPLMDAFKKKLQLVDESKCKNIIIISHYPAFLSQYNFSPNEEISSYFFNYQLGQIILEVTNRNKDKKFYVVSGHGHEYMTNKWVDLTNNLKTFGLATTYTEQNYITLKL